ncbi:MAG: amidohydrolase family protein [Bryobacterales bacterium]|nr:amidohydrolase family protein [Bryobacterales bacterium]
MTLLLKNGILYDGSGADPVPGDLLIDGGRIASIGVINAPLCRTLDCTGLAVAPGFIDLHSHSDLQVLESERTEKVLQGVTTEVVGNCGFSPFPQGSHAHELCEFGGGILGRPAGWGWASAKAYLDTVAESGKNVRVAPLAGHGSLRVAVAGLRQGPLSTTEMDRLAGLLADSLDAGCAGFSTGLMYAPGSSAAPEELEHLCRLVAARDRLYTTHMRSYAQGLVEAVREQIALARATGCRLQISHLQAAGRANWNLQQRALDEIETARAAGVDVEFDIYPYQCGSTVLTQWLPFWALDGGATALVERLRTPATRALVRDETEGGMAQSWSDITISGVASAANAALIGRTIADVAAERGCQRRRHRARSAGRGERRRQRRLVQPERIQSAATALAPALLGHQRRLLRKRQTAPAAPRNVSGTPRLHRQRPALDVSPGGNSQSHGQARRSAQAQQARPAAGGLCGRHHGVRSANHPQPRHI